MDGGSFRAQRPTERRPVVRPVEPARVPQQELPQAPKTSAEPPRQAPVHKKEASKGRKRPLLFGLIGVVVAGIAVVAAMSLFVTPKYNIDSSKYQAVFLTNGQFYFGDLEVLNDEFFTLTNVYYMQTQSSDPTDTDAQASINDSNNYKLIKLGNEIHGPDDAMMIAKSQVSYYENLQPNGKVSQLIDQDSGK